MLNILRQVQGWVRLKGGSNGTIIGNVGDAIKTRSSYAKESLTAFGRIKTSIPSIIFEANFVENERADLFDRDLTGSATITRNTNKKHMELATTTASGDKVILRTFRYIKYTPGQSDGVVLVQHLSPKANVVQTAKLGDDNDGLFFRANGTGFEVGILSSISGSPVETIVTQANFNIDKLDGTGASGKTIDLTKTQIFFLDFQWLGAGSVRYGVFIDGNLIIFHQQDHANIIDESKYMRTASLPISWEIENTGTVASATTMEVSCCSVISEGVVNAPVQRASVTNQTSKSLNANGDYAHLISIRIGAGFDIGNLKPLLFNVLAATPDAMLAQLIIGGTITGGTWTQTKASSISDYNVTATAFSGGEVISETLVGQEARSVLDSGSVDVYIGRYISGASQTLTLQAKTLGNHAEVHGSVSWEEVY